MRVPLEIVTGHLPEGAGVEGYVRSRVERLERHHELMSCRVALEEPHRHRRTGHGWRVRIDLRIPTGLEIVVSEDSGAHARDDDLHHVVSTAFDTAERRLRKEVEQERGLRKAHPADEVNAFVYKRFDDHGFLRALDGRQVYFHRNSVVGGSFEDPEVGQGVHYAEEQGEEGPQASTVRLVPAAAAAQPRRHGG